MEGLTIPPEPTKAEQLVAHVALRKSAPSRQAIKRVLSQKALGFISSKVNDSRKQRREVARDMAKHYTKKLLAGEEIG